MPLLTWRITSETVRRFGDGPCAGPSGRVGTRASSAVHRVALQGRPVKGSLIAGTTPSTRTTPARAEPLRAPAIKLSLRADPGPSRPSGRFLAAIG
jgi:hypothetical protein